MFLVCLADSIKSRIVPTGRDASKQARQQNIYALNICLVDIYLRDPEISRENGIDFLCTNVYFVVDSNKVSIALHF